MAAYLITHGTARSQWSERAIPETGQVHVHTVESLMDAVGIDTGAENTAGFISHRTTPGSYNAVGDSDSSIELVPDHLAAFAIVSRDAWGVNLRHGSWSYSFATSASLWGTNPEWDSAAIDVAGRAIAAYLLRLQARTGHDPEASLRWLNADQVRKREPGLCLHGTTQGDRTDAWLTHPLRPYLEVALIAAIRRHLPTPTPEDWFDMATKEELRAVVREEVRDELVTQLGAQNLRLADLRNLIVWALSGRLPADDEAVRKALKLPNPATVLGAWNLRNKVEVFGRRATTVFGWGVREGVWPLSYLNPDGSEIPTDDD